MDFDYLVTNWLRAILLIAITYNPTGLSYLHWLEGQPDIPPTLIIFSSILIILGYVYFFKRAMKTVRGIGVIVLVILFLCLVVGFAQLSFSATINSVLGEWLMIATIGLFMSLAVSFRLN